MKRSIITLTTDFGTKDGYVGAVKGVIKAINRDAEVVDITHQVAPFDVLGAAFALRSFYSYFPRGTVHLVVVDPGVGSDRQPLLIRSEDFIFVGPDNGVFSFIYDMERITEIVNLSNKKYFLTKLSSTFHARDMFAPVAAYASLGIEISEFGNDAKDCFKFSLPQLVRTKAGLAGEIIHIDQFGNLVTNVPADILRDKKAIAITVGRRKVGPIVSSYLDIPKGKSGALVGSSGFLEIAMNQWSAQKFLISKIGTKVGIVIR